MSEDVTKGLPADLAAVLRDQSVVIAQDADVFELISAWAKAPSATASATIRVAPNANLVEELYRQSQLASSTTPANA
jgi:hypothetical protein